ncbi:unnamed protein product [Caenorhabditis auriculariae]|uniref:PPM-type phosphatase domain-containing protein n=1 Tax=Caenorhabditis auriculariae TaxID=2777116 RepID=A0A8S1GX68_9PELO|nr:unnamed protein product [Caenorhabditis auriculariae]
MKLELGQSVVRANGNGEISRKRGENLRITVAANQGGRKYMEDRVHIHTERNSDRSLKYTFLGVFDGHGGDEASDYVRNNLLKNITENPKFHSSNDEMILQAIREGFLSTHEGMKEVADDWPFTASGYPSTAGTTVSCIFIKNGKLYSGHVGDSAIFLGKRGLDGETIIVRKMTIDHKPENDLEYERIRVAGGRVVVKSGVARVIWRRAVKGQHLGLQRRSTTTEEIPFLSVARSLGDLWSFCEDTQEYIVSPDPDLDVCEIEDDDVCIVLASDGLTNVMTASQVVAVVEEEERVSRRVKANSNHARALLKSALDRWRSLRADNITVAAVMIDQEELKLNESQLYAKLGQYAEVHNLFTEKQDAMLQVTPTSNSAWETLRTPILYTGSKDPKFCKVSYRGPGFRTHEQELHEEEKHLRLQPSPSGGFELVEDGVIGSEEIQDDADILFTMEDGEDRALNRILREKTPPLSRRRESGGDCNRKEPELRNVLAGRALNPMENLDTSVASSLDESDEEDNLLNSAPSQRSQRKKTSPRTPKTCAILQKPRLRTPKMSANLEDSERRVTRSAAAAIAQVVVTSNAKNGFVVQYQAARSTVCLPPSPTTPTRAATNPEYGIITRSRDRSTRPNTVFPEDSSVNVTPKSICRKRKRSADDDGKSTGVTPLVRNMSLGREEGPTVVSRSASAPSTPSKISKEQELAVDDKVRASKWSLSKLDEMAEASRNVVEPPSKIRRIYGFMRRLVGLPDTK